MKIVVILGLLLTGGTFAQSLICNPADIKEDFGVAPTSLPYAYVGYPYTASLSVKIPKNTSKIPAIQNEINDAWYAIPFDSYGEDATYRIEANPYQILSVDGLPAGFTYECGGQSNCHSSGDYTSCIKITGLPQEGQENFYVINTEIKIYISFSAHYPNGGMAGMGGVSPKLIIPSILTIKPQDDQKLAITDVFSNPFDLFPNPATNKITINNVSDYSALNIYDTNGQLLSSEILNGSKQTVIDVAHLHKGIYFVQLVDTTGSKVAPTQKLIIQN